MRQIEDPASEALTVLQALESLARLAWNDDDVREQVAQMDGMHQATCMIKNMLQTLESVRVYFHKAETEPAFWQYWAANSESISVHPHKAELSLLGGRHRVMCECLGRDSAVRCMLRGTCQFAKLLHHK